MPVNPAELLFFQERINAWAKMPAINLAEMTLNDIIQSVSFFHEARVIGQPDEVSSSDTTITARDGYQIPITILNSDLQDVPAFIFYPGTAYCFEVFAENCVAISRIAHLLQAKIFIVKHRLITENSINTCLEDCFDALQAVAHNPQHYSVNERIFTGGYSSGAHACAGMSLLASKDQTINIEHQILLNGFYDMLGTCNDYREYELQDILCSRAPADLIYSHYDIPKTQYSEPLYSPLYCKDFTGFPSTTILVSEYDGLRSDSEAYYCAMKDAGHEVNKIVLTGQTHNTFLLRGVMSDGEDPAKIFADVIKSKI